MDEYIGSRVIFGIRNLQLPQDMKITLSIAERIRDSEGIEITCLLVDFDMKSYCKRYDLIHTRKYFADILENVYALKLKHCDYRNQTTAVFDVNIFYPCY